MKRAIDLLEKIGLGVSLSGMAFVVFALEGDSITCGQAVWMGIVFSALSLWLTYRRESRR